jgi:FkbM family methyltransferase
VTGALNHSAIWGLASTGANDNYYGRMQSYSQFGEDVLLWEHFHGKADGFFVEAGANHPTLCSQTWLLEQRGWKGILVEPIGEKFELIRRERPASRVIRLALGAPEQRGRARFNVAAGNDALSGLSLNEGVTAERVEEVEVRTLDDVLAEAGNPRLDLVSIDVEGVELEVLRGFDLARHRPAVLLVEDHLQKMKVHRHITRQNYRLVKRTGCNNWYVPRDAEFKLTTAGERFSLRKEIWLDTPVRCVRYFFKRWRSARKPAAAV